MRPKLVTGVLVGGTLVLGGGSALAASLPSWTTRPAHAVAAAPTAGKEASASPAISPSSIPVPAPSSTAPSSTAPSGVASSSAPPADVQAATPNNSAIPKASRSRDQDSITYTVKPGDTLSGIAEWFMLHGYGELYEANKAVIGDNPDLIFPGERITIAHGVMKLSKRQ